jgi:hypothetical protein
MSAQLFVVDGLVTEYSQCIRCGRPLENPTSRERGFGPVCYQKVLVTLHEVLSESMDEAMEGLGVSRYDDGSSAMQAPLEGI